MKYCVKVKWGFTVFISEIPFPNATNSEKILDKRRKVRVILHINQYAIPTRTNPYADGRDDGKSKEELMREKGEESNTDRACREIKELLMSYQIHPGQQLTCQSLADKLGVSRTPIRDALKRLEQECFVDSFSNRGFFVRELDVREAEELYDVREALEALSAEKGAQNPKPERLAMVKRAMDAYARKAGEKLSRERFLLDLDFHIAIAELAGNGVLKEILHQVLERIIMKRKMEGLPLYRGKIPSEEHRRIFAAISNGDARRASRLMRSHIRNSRANLLAPLKEREAVRRI
jgi:DNA-binding GntR family transcriptional regulator